MQLNFGGKRVLVTGASRGIGLAIAEGFLSEGAEALLVARGGERLEEAARALKSSYGDAKVWTEPCDCTDADSLAALEGQVRDRWGGLDVVVANVGDGRSVADPLPAADHWAALWRVNFDSALLTARTFLPLLQASKGALLFISSIAGLEAFGAPVDYSTAKSAVGALAKNMARKLAPDVRVNVVAPGNVFFEGGSWDEKRSENAERVEQLINSTVPMQRFGTPQEIADAVIFLCSERASFITGSTLVVDGGQTVSVF